MNPNAKRTLRPKVSFVHEDESPLAAAGVERPTVSSASRARGLAGVKTYDAEPGVSAGVVVLPVKRIEPIFVSSSEVNVGGKWIWQHSDWPRFEWDAEVLAVPLGQARKAQGRLVMAREMLTSGLAKDALMAVLKQEGISTSAIEGEHLNPESVADSIARRLGISLDPRAPRAPLSLEADGLVSVLLDAVETHREPLGIPRILSWHKALLGDGKAGFHPVVTGALRPEEVFVKSGAMGREVTHFQAVPGGQVEENVETFLAWFNSSQGNLDGLLRAGIAHLWFVTIHPFEDGNGRLTRAITDRAIAQDEDSSTSLLKMSARIMAVRGDYYAALQATQTHEAGLNITPWLRWFVDQVEGACKTTEAIIKTTLGKAKFWARHHGAPFNERQRKALNRLLDAGPEGFEGGLTNRKYVAMTKASHATAYRDIEELLTLGCLVPKGPGGRSTAYDMPWNDLLI